MISRPEALELLLGSRLNWLPSSRVAATYADISGPTPGDRVRCNRCRNTGRVIGDGATAVPCQTCVAAKRYAEERGLRYSRGCSRCRPCLLCDATGWRPLVDSEYDDQAELVTISTQPFFDGETGEDEYLRPGKHGLWAEAHTKAEARRRLEALVAALEEQRKVREGVVFDPREFGWLRDRDAHYAAGDYTALDRALERLYQRSMVLSHAVWTLYVYEPHLALRQDSFGRGPLERTAAVGFAYLLVTMPDPIRVPVWLLPERESAARKESLWRGRGGQVAQREARDEEIWTRYERGAPVAELCERFSLSRPRIYAILATQFDREPRRAS